MLCGQTNAEDRSEVHIIGVAMTDMQNQLQLLLETWQSVYSEGETWKHLDEELEKDEVTVNKTIKGKEIMQIEKYLCQ